MNLLDSLAHLDQTCSVIIVTTDKVYKNYESQKGYSENSELGGYDPYSASKAAIELLVDSWRNSSYFTNQLPFSHRISTVRSGNVIGGGDWSPNRIVPDIVNSLKSNSPLNIRSPLSVRPWQHVLDTLHGYILLAQTIADNFDSSFHTRLILVLILPHPNLFWLLLSVPFIRGLDPIFAMTPTQSRNLLPYLIKL